MVRDITGRLGIGGSAGIGIAGIGILRTGHESVGHLSASESVGRLGIGGSAGIGIAGIASVGIAQADATYSPDTTVER